MLSSCPRAFKGGLLPPVTLNNAMACQLLWYKRDLRVFDHAPLAHAAAMDAQVVGLFIVEPERFVQDDFDPIHLAWELDHVRDVQEALRARGTELLVAVGEPHKVLSAVCTALGVTDVHSYEESGVMWTWERDKRVAERLASCGVHWHEYPSNGVVRRLSTRDRWQQIRDRRVRGSVYRAPASLQRPGGLQLALEGLDSWGVSTRIPAVSSFGLEARALIDRPHPGRVAAVSTLRSFLEERGRPYRWAMSSPVAGAQHCSRISPYLAAGVLSIREVDRAVGRRIDQLRGESAPDQTWIKSLSSFRSRLAWHCHFIQKLEMEPSLDTLAQNPALDERIGRVFDGERMAAWSEGRTGIPFLDACMRQLIATGWINFRMRAMLQSVATFALWLPWRETGAFLARQFLDYEPGIHWSQIGMQSATTGINTVRAYSVLKQSQVHDPDGEYIRKWIPALQPVPTAYIHEPGKMPLLEQQMLGVTIGEDYPVAVVNEAVARKEAVARVYAARDEASVRVVSSQVAAKHGSRKRRSSRR